jgi:predicted membrane GTPase involved in stress response
LKPGIADAICLKLGIIFRYPKASAKITFHMVKAVMVTIENEVKPMEDDDTVVLTPEDIEKIQKEMLEKDNEKDNEEQEED